MRESSPTHKPDTVVINPWNSLRRYTDARIGLGRSGGSLPTQQLLAFQLDHAQARDAVDLPLDTQTLMAGLHERVPLVVRLHSQANDRSEYLRRPDLGRCLDQESAQQLADLDCAGCEVSLCLVDGLSARAIHEQALPFLDVMLPRLAELGLNVGPVALVEQGRVAVGDPVGEALNASMSIVLIGERPGLSSPDSMGIYFTWQPHAGVMDSARNCISNVRPRGQGFQAAAGLLTYLIRGAQEIQASGVALKDDSDVASELGDGHSGNFLLP